MSFSNKKKHLMVCEPKEFSSHIFFTKIKINKNKVMLEFGGIFNGFKKVMQKIDKM
jgi:hypothetical protein